MKDQPGHHGTDDHRQSDAVEIVDDGNRQQDVEHRMAEHRKDTAHQVHVPGRVDQGGQMSLDPNLNAGFVRFFLISMA